MRLIILAIAIMAVATIGLSPVLVLELEAASPAALLALTAHAPQELRSRPRGRGDSTEDTCPVAGTFRDQHSNDDDLSPARE